MLTRLTGRKALVPALSMAFLAGLPGSAAAGEFEVATCQADGLNYSTEPFDDFATRGMGIRRACDPEGPGLRGLVTSNVRRRGNVSRGAVAMVAFAAPSGTRFKTLRWAGTAHRRDCGYALQLYAETPDGKAIPIKNVRANQRCPRSGRYQAAAYRARTFDVSGATRIVQRVVCVGNRGGKPCAANGSNYILTYKAQVRVEDVLGPSVSILGDTALGRGDWVSGTQPLNYDASDNVGVRSAQAIVGSQAGGTHQRPCLFASSSGAYANDVPCANGPGTISVDTKSFPEGAQSLLIQAQDAAGNAAASQPATVQIDNTPPGRVDAAVDGGDGWRAANDFGVGWSNPAEADRAPIASVTYKLCPAAGGACSRVGGAKLLEAELRGIGVVAPSCACSLVGTGE